MRLSFFVSVNVDLVVVMAKCKLCLDQVPNMLLFTLPRRIALYVAFVLLNQNIWRCLRPHPFPRRALSCPGSTAPHTSLLYLAVPRRIALRIASALLTHNFWRCLCPISFSKGLRSNSVHALTQSLSLSLGRVASVPIPRLLFCYLLRRIPILLSVCPELNKNQKSKKLKILVEKITKI